MTTYDAIIQVKFLTPEQGGREHSIQGCNYSCPLIVDEQGFDCRFVLEEEQIFNLGSSYKIPIRFLNFKTARPYIEEGRSLALWEGKIIATGTIFRISEDFDKDDR